MFVVKSPLPLVLSVLVALFCEVSSQAQTNPYESEILVFEAEDAKAWPPPNSIVFVGSSTINMWDNVGAAFPKYNILNRGFGGSQTSDALYYVDRIATPYRPPLLVFYEGDNDVAAGVPVDQIFQETTNFFARAQSKSPNTHILYVSVKPSPSRVSYMPAMSALNAKVRDFTATNPKLHFVDVYTAMLNNAGQPRAELFLPDNLHMNETGYALWTSILSPVLDDFAAHYPIPIARPQSGSLLIDFGGADALSGGSGSASVAWNNVTSIGSSSAASLANAVTMSGVTTGVALQMISRFNGANENGTTMSTLFPATATRDSLFGNTETFSGLANITPIFKLTGLATASAYRLTFYASRTGVTDNRQTRYTATGATTASADLNPANNVDQVATIANLQPDANGAITIALTPGPSNNNANHFTYLGVLKAEALAAGGPAFLFDFGATGTPTPTQTGPAIIRWNDVTPDTQTIANLIATNGMATPIGFQITSRFNAANASGTTASTLYPASAAQDSLFGNTESFGSLANITPKFALQNLDPNALYDLNFYASRTGVTDNRETRYTVAGATTNSADLNASGNVNTVAAIEHIKPDSNRELSIALTPGPNNDNANHFTYLGVLQLNWRTASAPPPIKIAGSHTPGVLKLTLEGASGMIYTLQTSSDLKTWENTTALALTNSTGNVEITEPTTNRFYRLLQ